ncbi:hypothetical protein [Amniculibacterium aquaticum]|uniref:hypothetical protein n=1 Tax=Amniculibacterium aquaticum TaxID=2479858 RepID=UPI000F599B9D|nr:hypothetical protein [Amniculibacterium aquaticum]
MNPLDILHFEQLKTEVQNQYLKNHTPSHDDISKWKGIDIIYFQEDLRKITKANISEKSFYTYFKSSSVTKLPRIDMLNLLSIYAGYASWYEFKKTHLFANEVLNENEDEVETGENPSSEQKIDTPSFEPVKIEEKEVTSEIEKPILQTSESENKDVTRIPTINLDDKKRKKNSIVKENLWVAISILLLIMVAFFAFKDMLLMKEYTFKFIDADRNSNINADLDVKILNKNESPILIKVLPNQPFVYKTHNKELTMVVSSPYYKSDTIQRNLVNAPDTENIELKPNDYAIMLYYYSKSIQDLKKKRENLNKLINNNAVIYQVFDNERYGVETMDKQRYISLVTLPTTSLENLDVIDIIGDKNGKISMIKFKIGNNEKNK